MPNLFPLQLLLATFAGWVNRHQARGVTLEFDALLALAFNKMSSGDYRHIPVTRDGRVEGVVSLRDGLRFLSEWYPDLIPAE